MKHINVVFLQHIYAVLVLKSRKCLVSTRCYKINVLHICWQPTGQLTFSLCKSAATQLQGWQHHFVILTDALGKGP